MGIAERDFHGCHIDCGGSFGKGSHGESAQIDPEKSLPRNYFCGKSFKYCMCILLAAAQRNVVRTRGAWYASPVKPKLIHGDCLLVMRDLPAESVDVVVTSPPYNLDIGYGAPVTLCHGRLI